ncbi:protein phosphatase 1 regulatory subunit 27 [Platysternon megacephalum]|uniref:Protein phosphatase 1 regulatory subunit 27 n=1 Tax=Platysternon megacephalum TaxID=55544 RepID=A0A4D9DEE1_9SAUR|nr:protein phosphatase 1 regulatory subunit 27 [Platysternon megacephalum]
MGDLDHLHFNNPEPLLLKPFIREAPDSVDGIFRFRKYRFRNPGFRKEETSEDLDSGAGICRLRKNTV